MKIAVTGAGGLIGCELVRRGCTPILSNILSKSSLKDEIDNIQPEIVIHCAAITDVPFCEDHFQTSFDVNVRGTMNVVNALPYKALLIYLSTDHVFSGQQFFTQGYGEWQKPSPINRYGFSKWGGEEMVKTSLNPFIIVRSSKVFNYAWAKPTLDILKDDGEVVMTDLIKRSFLHVQHFVDSLLKLADIYKEGANIPEILNISGDCVFSYYMFWSIVSKVMNLSGQVIPRKEALQGEVPRPFRGGLCIGKAKKLGIPIYSIADGIKLLEQGI